MDEMTMQFLLDNYALLIKSLARVVYADEETKNLFVKECLSATKGRMNPKLLVDFLEYASRPDGMKLI